MYVGDVARAIEVITRDEPEIQRLVDGKIIEAGGPDGKWCSGIHSTAYLPLLVFTYRQIMELVLRYTGRWRPIISVPYAVGTIQGLVLEQLPLNLFTLTRAQVRETQ